ncbi:MAG TPA: hypothetical protein VKM93_06880 [Terriglobia bacterium]|nr:hypothetical protein [Terriglobia bacterium]
MFIVLLVVTFLVSLVVSSIVVALFSKPVGSILSRVVSDEISQAWLKYLKFAIYVVGISSGVRVWDLEKYITPAAGNAGLTLTRDRWVLEVYRSIITSLQGLAWLLLVFFMFALIAFVIVRVFELRSSRAGKAAQA